MKRIISAAVVMMVLLFLIQTVKFTPVSQIESDGQIIGNNKFETSLSNKDEVLSVINMESVNALDGIYEQMGSYFIGEDRVPVNISYPMYINDNAGIAFLSDEGTLYDERFDVYTVAEKYIVSDGTLYDQFLRGQGEEVYLFFESKSGLFVNTKEMTLQTGQRNITIPLNSILNIEEDMLRYYYPDGDELHYRAVGDVDSRSIVTMNGVDYTWRELLMSLGIISEEKEPSSKAEEEEVKEEKDKEEKQATEKRQEENKQESGQESQGNNSSEGSQGTADPGYVEPVVTPSGYTSTVYSISSHIDISDPQGNLYRNRAEVQVWYQGKIYMRKYIRRSQDYTISGLEPGKNYTMVVTYKYEDAKGETQEKTFEEVRVRTKDFSTLTPIVFSMENGSIYAKKIQLQNIKLESPAEEEAVQNISRMVLRADGKNYGFRAAQIQAMRDGEAITFETDESITSNQAQMDYSIHAYDSFGNELVCQGNAGSTRTCKQAPVAKIRTLSNKVSDVKFSLALENPDGVELKDYRLVAKDSNDNIIMEKALALDEKTLNFDNMDAGRTLHIQILAGFDVDDGEGFKPDQILADTQIVTVPLSNLGKFYMISTVKELRYNEIVMSYRLESRTNSMLVDLLQEMTLSLANAGQSKDVKLTEEQLNALKEGQTIDITYSGLTSKTDYTVGAKTVVHHGTTDYHDFETVMSTKEVKTLRRPAWIETRNMVIKEDTISFDVRAIDPDGAVIDGYVGMRVLREDETVMDVIKIDTVSREDDDGWVSYTYTVAPESLARPFVFEFYAVEYNEAYTVAERQANKIIHRFSEQTLKSIKGTVGISQISNLSKDERRVDMMYSISDSGRYIKDGDYTFVIYKNGEEERRETYTMSAGTTYITHNDFPVAFDLPVNADYRIELWVTNTGLEPDEEQMLDSVTFDTFYEVQPIRTPEDLYNVKNDPSGHYLVVNSLDLTANPQSIDVPFTGEIDFGGCTVKVQVTDTWRYLFKQNKGVLKGAVIDASYINTTAIDSVRNSGDTAGAFVLENEGTVQDVMLEFAGTTELANDGIAGLIYNNKAKGILENFVIHARGAMHTKRNSAYGVAVNAGTIRNGYAYGTSINASYANTLVREVDWEGNVMNNAEFRKRVGGIAGYNTGTMYNLFSLTTVILPADQKIGIEELDETAVGNVLGVNNGTIRNVYSTGEENYQDAALDRGPAVGYNLNGTVTNNNVYYISDSGHSNPKLNKRVTALKLYDEDFQSDVLNSGDGGAFSTNVYPALGYYPQVALPEYMPAQELIPLPVVDTSEAVDIKSIEVLEYTDDTARVKLVLNNPGSGDVQAISVADIGVTRVESYTHERKQTTVIIKMSKPAKYYSVYSVASVRIKNNYGGGYITRKYGAGEQQIFAEFFRPIETELDWSNYVIKNQNENYKLEKDLDFSGYTAAQLYLSDYRGTLDGRGHSISNMAMESRIGVFQYIRNGGLRDITFNNVTGNALRGLVYYIPSGTSADFDHVFINHIELKGNNENMGGLIAGVNGNAKVTNCGVNTVITSPSGNTSLGGLIGQSLGSAVELEIRNSYAVNIQLNTGSGYAYGTGGLVGRLIGGKDAVIEDCYAAGQITGYTQNVGGLIGYNSRGTNIIRRCYTDVDIRLNAYQGTTYPGSGFIGSGSFSSSGDAIYNHYVQGDLYNERVEGSMKRVLAMQSGYDYFASHEVYAAASQLINGQKVGMINNEKVSGLLTYEELVNPETLRTTVGLGDAYDYSGTAEGYLPKLKGTDGVLLPYQENLELSGAGEMDNMQIQSVDVSEKSDTQAVVMIYVSHPAGMDVTKADMDGLSIVSSEVISQGQDPELGAGYNRSVIKMTVRPEKYFDAYTISKLYGSSAGEAKEKETNWRVMCQFYKNITSYDDWQTISNDQENYRLTADIDFNGRGDYMHRNLKVNRFEGVVKADGTYPVLKNIHLNLNGNNIKGNTANVFDYVQTRMANLRVENYTVKISNPSRYQSTVGFLRYTTGRLESISIDGMELCVPETEGERAYGNYVGFLAQGHSWERPIIRNIVVKNVKAYGANYVGALVGLSAPNTQYVYGENLEVEGYLYVGGLFGTPSQGSPTHIVVKDASVTAKANYAGGVCGSGTANSAYVENADVKAKLFAGGITGWRGVSNCYVKDSTITASDYGAAGITARSDTYTESIINNYVENCTITSQKGAAGGIHATGCYDGTKKVVGTDTDVIRDNGVINTTITAGGSAGGVAGETYGNVYRNFVRGCTVTGGEYAGGVAGTFEGSYNRYVSGNLVASGTAGDTQVISTAGSAGGVLGYFPNTKNAAQRNQLKLNNNILAGAQIEGSGRYAGGLVGEIPVSSVFDSSANDWWDGNILVDAKMHGSTYQAVQVGNLGGQEETLIDNMWNLKVHSGVIVGNQSAGMINSYQEILVTKEELKTPAFYTGIGFLQAGNSWNSWVVSGIVDAEPGYVPIDSMGDRANTYAGTTLAAMAEVHGESYAGSGNALLGQQKQRDLGLIELPEDVTGYALRRSPAGKTQEIPELLIYPSGVDTLNLEFSHTGDSLAFFLNGDDSRLEPIDSRTKTLQYDFSEPFTITITNYQEDKEITVLPGGYTRKVMVYQDEYYYIAESGVTDSEGEIAGSFRHLYQGKALTTDGEIVDVLSGASVGSVKGVSLLDEAVPMQAFTYGEGEAETYGSYTVVGGETERAMQLFLKDGNLSMVDGALDNVKDSILVDSYQGKDYQVVLGTDGVLYNLKEEINMPEEFDNSGIKYMASNLESNGHWLLVEYENGAAAGFDYVTGESIFEKKGDSDLNLLEFARSFLSMKASLLSDELPQVYGTLEVLKEQLSETPIDSLLKDMEGAEQGAELNIGKQESSDDSEVTMTPESGDAGSGSSYVSEAGQQAFEQEGSQYIAYYDSEASEYVLYNSDEVLDAQMADISSENAKINGSAVLKDYYAVPSTYVRVSENIQGIVILGGVLLLIGSGVVFLMFKRRKMQ